MKVKFGGNEVNLLGEEIKVGVKAPEFKATRVDLSTFNSLENLGKVIIYSIAPSVDTPVCSLQTTIFNEEASKLSDDIKIITISVDLPFALGRFCANKGIEKTETISDYQGHEFGKKYGFLMEGNMLLARGIVIVDKDGVVKYVEYVPEVTNEVNFDKALEEAKKLI